MPFLAQNRFNKFERYNFVVSGNQTELVSVETSGRGAVVVLFPDELYLTNVAHGYGNLEISKVYSAGQLDHRGGEVLRQTVSDYVGLPVDGNIRSDRKLSASDPKSFFLNLDFLAKDGGDISVLDRAEVAKAFLSMRFDKITVVDLSPSADQLLLADGSTATAIDQGKLDQLLKNLFVENRIYNDNLRVAIINTTSVTGLGNRAARLLNNIGATVVDVSTSEPMVTKCRIQVSLKNKNSLTAMRISDIFSCQSEDMVSSSKADLIVVLGQNYADLFSR